MIEVIETKCIWKRGRIGSEKRLLRAYTPGYCVVEVSAQVEKSKEL